MKNYSLIAGIAILTGMIILSGIKGNKAENTISAKNQQLESIYNW